MPDTIYLISKFLIDPFSNSLNDQSDYEPYGYTITEAEAKKICEQSKRIEYWGGSYPEFKYQPLGKML